MHSRKRMKQMFLPQYQRRLAPPAASTDSVDGGHTAATSNTTATTVATSSTSGGPTIDPSTASLRSSSSHQGSVDGVMQRCGLCSIISSLLRRAMCVGSRRGSGESYYQELAETNTHECYGLMSVVELKHAQRDSGCAGDEEFGFHFTLRVKIDNFFLGCGSWMLLNSSAQMH
uniref:Uncharacterized protein n=1 Tax=Anopheles melas TaxID=34690 RepID=A0A182UJP5_9DIPT